MRGSERPDPGLGSFEFISQIWLANIDRATKVYEPAAKSIGQYNAALIGLATRRTLAWIDIPSRLMQCKNPQDVIGAQSKFWQTATSQYLEGWQQMATALRGLAVVPALNGGLDGSVGTPARDIITFAETPDQAEPREDKRSDRKAA